MSDQEQTENSGGIGVSGVVGGAGAAVGTAYLADRHFAGSAIKKHLAGEKVDPRIAEKTSKLVAEAFAKDATAQTAAQPVAEGAKVAKAGLGLNAKDLTLRELKAIDPATVHEVHFSEVKDGVHTAYFNTQSGSQVVVEGIKKLPEGVESLPVNASGGKSLTITADNAAKITTGEKSFLKDIIANEEKSLVSGLRKTAGLGASLKVSSKLGMVGIAAGTVAATVAGAKVTHAIFGGKHTDQVAANRNDVPEQGAARA